MAVTEGMRKNWRDRCKTSTRDENLTLLRELVWTFKKRHMDPCDNESQGISIQDSPTYYESLSAEELHTIYDELLLVIIKTEMRPIQYLHSYEQTIEFLIYLLSILKDMHA